MASYNRVVLMGNLTRDPELRYIPSGMAVSDIGMAINDRVKRNDQWTEEVTFVDVTLWGRTAEVANEYLSKGSSVLIEGRLKLDTWEKDGQKRSKLKVVGEKMQMLGGKGGGSAQRASDGSFQGQQSYQSQQSDQGQPEFSESMPSQSAPPAAPSMPPNDEIPF